VIFVTLTAMSLSPSRSSSQAACYWPSLSQPGPMPTIIRLISLLSFLLPLVAAQHSHGMDMDDMDHGGMDMSMDGPMNLAAGNMISYFHFTPGDILWFYGWVPKSIGAMVGTCIGLTLLAVMERWLGALRAGMERFWMGRSMLSQANALNRLPTEKSDKSVTKPDVLATIFMRRVPPFVLSHDFMRGVLHAGQSAIGFALMLSVMTFQLSFLISVVVGLGIGETLFGRYIAAGGMSAVIEAHC
jgi:copper transporter 1